MPLAGQSRYGACSSGLHHRAAPYFLIRRTYLEMDGTFTTLTHVEAHSYLTFPGSVVTLNPPGGILARLLAQAHP